MPEPYEQSGASRRPSSRLDLERLTPERITEIERAAKVVLAQRQLIPFCQVVDESYQAPAHIKLLARYLEWVEATPGALLLLSMPPRFGKTALIGEKFVPWALSRNPKWGVIYASYTISIARAVSRSVKNLISDEPGYHETFPRHRITSDSASATEWNLIVGDETRKVATKDPSMLAVGVGGSVTGFGANLFIIDDPIKNAEEAYSAVYREKLWEWWLRVARTRLNPGARIVLISTRWHFDDLMGRLLKDREWSGWKYLNLPALASMTVSGDAGDPLGRFEGESLWPERFPQADLEKLRASAPNVFLTMYQGVPIKEGGSILQPEKFGVWVEPPKKVISAYCAADTALTEKTRSDNTALAIGAVVPGGYADILDFVTGKWESVELEEQIVAFWRKWKAIYGVHLRGFLIESNAHGLAVIQHIRAAHRDIPIIAVNAEKDKVARGQLLGDQLDGGRIRVPAYAGWLQGLVEEMRSFPLGNHDDRVDTLGILVDKLLGISAAAKTRASVYASELLGVNEGGLSGLV